MAERTFQNQIHSLKRQNLKNNRSLCDRMENNMNYEVKKQILDKIKEYDRNTDIFIYPGYRFKVLDCLITNFHLPESSLVMLVSAFAGRENVLAAYREAVREKYRFFSFGDAMLIV